MSIISKIVRSYYSGRNREIDFFRKNPILTARNQFDYLIENLAKTKYGKSLGVTQTTSQLEFSKRLPIVTYEDIAPDIEKILNGDWRQFWTSQPKWYAKSSGTTTTVSKFIPTTTESLEMTHYRGMQDVAAVYSDLYPNGKAFNGKTLTLGGTLVENSNKGGGLMGDLSGILITNTPTITDLKRIPSKKISLLPDFEKKIELITKIGAKSNVTTFAGVPSWYMVLMNSILDYTGKNNMCEVWENIDFFAHGGMSFTPYREQYERLFPSSEMKYMETYNASEGFFALQDDTATDDMLLMLDYKIYYEFLETSSLDTPQNAIPLEDVKCGVNYAIIISTCGGLWRYMIGDTVTFTSTNPYKIKITGRTKHFINIAGEEIIIENADKAIQAACQATSAQVTDYTAAPIYMDGRKKGGHEWIFEFETEPTSLRTFIETLDHTLQAVNSDYNVKRTGGALAEPIVHIAPTQTFYIWMKSRGKLGGQNKIPRLSNNRTYIDPLLDLIKTNICI